MIRASDIKANPILGLRSAARLGELDELARDVVVSICLDLHAQAAELAEKQWRKKKAPMATYWKGASVYAGHFGRAVKRMAREAGR